MKLEKIKLRSFKTAVLATWGLCIVLLAVGYWGLCHPQQIALEASDVDLAESADMLMLAKKASKAGTLELLQEKNHNHKELIERYSIDEDGVTGLVFEIGQIANKLDLSDYSSEIREKVTLSTVSKCKLLDEGWLTITFLSSFNQFAEFLNELERSQPVVFIEKVNFKRDNVAAEQNEISMELSFLTTEQDGTGSASLAKSH